ncbi:MAG: molecular chaperone HtpG [Bacillota bacterium]
MAKTKKFKTESQKLLNLMINSIYTHKDIFLRELISNASDAIDKRAFLSLTDDQVKAADGYNILITPDEKNRTLSIEDNGIGLTEEELINNLGTIAESGSKTFLEKLEKKEDLDIIGQFGVGFYSAFMVADKVTILTKSPYADTGYKWVSKGESTYQIEPTKKEDTGTIITLHLRADNEEEETNYSEYLDDNKIKTLVKKYSDYVRYPIQMFTEEEDEDGNKEETLKTLNSRIPLWKKPKNEVKDEDLNTFYKHKFNAFEDPLHVIHTKVEGMLTYTALLFIPQSAPQNFYTDSYEKGLQLYSKGVFIQDKNKDLIPDYFRFVKGLVDSADLSLNLSREMLQHDRQLKKIAAHVEKKIKSELEKMLKNDRDKYITFYKAFGNNIKYGIYDNFGAKKDFLKDLIMFTTNKSEDYITLNDYIERKPDDQKAIYYATGKTRAQILNQPQMEAVKDKDYEVLLFTDEIDEFMVQVLNSYEDIPFKSLKQSDEDLLDETKKEDIKQEEKTHKSLLKAIKKALDGKVKDVKLSGRLKDAPVCLISGEGLSLEMEKILKQMPQSQQIKADRILEINPHHDLFNALKTIHEKDKNKIKDYASLLYHQALLIEGFDIDDPVEFSNQMVKLMVDSSNK